MRQAPALLFGQPFDFEGEKVNVVGSDAHPSEEVWALADMQAALDPGMARAKIGEKPRRHAPRLRFGSQPKHLLFRFAPRVQTCVGAQQAMHQLLAGVAQGMAGTGKVKLSAALLEELHLQRFRKLRELQRYGGLREMQLLGGARDA